MVVAQEVINERRAERLNQLEKIDQEYGLDGQDETVAFKGCSYVAMVEPKMIKFNRNGDMTVGFTIPARYVDSVLQLRAAMRTPILLRVEPWKPDNGRA